jgi:hypothetical protein
MHGLLDEVRWRQAGSLDSDLGEKRALTANGKGMAACQIYARRSASAHGTRHDQRERRFSRGVMLKSGHCQDRAEAKTFRNAKNP